MKLAKTFKRASRFVTEAGSWKAESRACLYQDFFHSGRKSRLSDEVHIDATLNWLKLAQDATGDGGVSGRYHLRSGWSRSYPETTGYIIPTFLDLAARRKDGELIERAERMLSFLLHTQMPDGAFPGGEIGTTKPYPIVFNTAQILQGLLAWYELTKEQRVIDAATRAARWLTLVQEKDGSWRKFTYAQTVTTYHARVAWPLAEFGSITGQIEFLDAASRHIDWILSHADRNTGWIDRMGFYEEDHELRRSLTHTIAYTYRGLFELAIILRRNDYWDILLTANERLLRRFEIKGKLAAAFDHDWKECANYVCLTGCAQLAGIWMRLYRRFGDIRFLNGALKALDLVKNTQILDLPYPGINGGVAGSFPIWGTYIRFAFPNWAAKFLLDGLLYAQDCIKCLESQPQPQSTWRLPAGVPRGEALEAAGRTRKCLRVVLLSVPGSTKGYEIGTALLQHNVYPEAVVLDAGLHDSSRFRRAFNKLRSGGLSDVLRALFSRISPKTPMYLSSGDNHESVEALRSQGVPCLLVSGINLPSSVDLVNRLQPDLLILAGAGILRNGILKIPRFGTLNAHMGLLPFFRGMNVAEWAAITGAPLGCSVHYVDEGVDTGRILATKELPRDGIGDIETLRECVNRAQVDLLCKVLVAITEGQELPSYCQLPEQGLQFFRMHPVLRRILGDWLQRAADVRPTHVSNRCPA